MTRTTTIDIGFTENLEPKTLVGKWKKCYKNKPKKKGRFSQGLFLYSAFSLLYTMLRYIVHHGYRDYDPWTIYYIKVLAAYGIIMGIANWLCALLYDNSVGNCRDRAVPNYYQTNLLPIFYKSTESHSGHNKNDQIISTVDQQRGQNGIFALKSRNGEVNNVKDHQGQDQNGNSLDNDVLEWNYCETCDLRTPPRAYHCDACQTCIIKRDHHCYFVGKCVGFKTQRYFVVMLFYIFVMCVWGAYLSFVYLLDNIWPAAEVSDIILPVTIFRTIFGSIPLHHCFIVSHCYLLTSLGFVTMSQLYFQIVLIINGMTMYELVKNVSIRNTNSVSKNISSVFGDFWAINFLFPGQILFRQRDDGYSWEGVKLLRPSNTNNKTSS